ncbi:MAG: protein translocase subunit SecD [Deltaproteobacteria bacterium]|nr:protein translocase subunit SecD [Deltaproteobacteria bacterium]MBW1920492.1 protein translocase subunit SecD [Deltaproteobacteria bacterium]MBW1934726.1 protein translocase subunit SecD [Deltaproteobacteria bacterium]MBW1976973.1 protein translocase subunit SecD [Deltaproteobacteria bacterium]MBW2046329.1 protein translocase subunit SecD [Deltaproteobacteria bacterium]
MTKKLGWRAGIIGFLVVVAFIYLVPSFNLKLPSWWSGLLPKDKIHLGLDLQGGVHLVLGVEVQKAVESDLERMIEELKNDLRKNKIRYLELKRQGTEGIKLTLMREKDEKALQDLVKSSYRDFDIKPLSTTDTKGYALELVLSDKARNHIMKLAADQALETIRNRVDQFGVSEPDIRPQEDYRILIQLPGIKDPKRAIDLIGKTALLEFKLLDEENSVEEALKGNIPVGDQILYQIAVDPKTGIKRKIPYLVKKRTLLTGEYLTDARVQIDPQYNEPYVSLSFDARGARLFERITGENIGKRLAIVLDNNVYSAPVIRDKIAGGRAQITGRFTMDEARDLSIVLRAGALPAPVKILEERTVGPSLGKDSINKGFKSTIIGGIVVVAFMAIYYGLSGLFADLALVLNMLFIMAGLAFFGATLTLPGIAGIILTIGMSVDANVLIFERIREELRVGKPPRAAIEAGYGRAMVTILDANVTTFIAALVLFQFGTGPVKGFAVTLSIGIVASFVTAVFVTRIIFDYLFLYRRWKKISI